MRSLPLEKYGQVTLDASGNGRVDLTPQPNETWKISAASVSTSTAVKAPVCKIYVGMNPSQANFVDGTYTGNQNTTDALDGYVITAGTRVIAEWTGGDAGAIAALTLRGTKTVPI